MDGMMIDVLQKTLQPIDVIMGELESYEPWSVKEEFPFPLNFILTITTGREVDSAKRAHIAQAVRDAALSQYQLALTWVVDKPYNPFSHQE